MFWEKFSLSLLDHQNYEVDGDDEEKQPVNETHLFPVHKACRLVLIRLTYTAPAQQQAAPPAFSCTACMNKNNHAG